MTRDAIQDIVKKDGLYRTPALNDKLYLQFRGFQSIQSLEEYTGLRVLWLEGNGIDKIENLDYQRELRTLYLQQNLIRSIENLESCRNIDTLDLSKNYISKIEKLSHLRMLKTLILSHNNLTDAKSIEHVTALPELCTLDLQSNKISGAEDHEEVVKVVKMCPSLRVLYLKGNGITKRIPFYRRTLLSSCSELRYLDDRPVFDEERRRCNAWGDVIKNGGSIEDAKQAEQAMIGLIRMEKQECDERNHRLFKEMAQCELLDGNDHLVHDGSDGIEESEQNKNKENICSSTDATLGEKKVGDKSLERSQCFPASLTSQNKAVKWDSRVTTENSNRADGCCEELGLSGLSQDDVFGRNEKEIRSDSPSRIKSCDLLPLPPLQNNASTKKVSLRVDPPLVETVATQNMAADATQRINKEKRLHGGVVATHFSGLD